MSAIISPCGLYRYRLDRFLTPTGPRMTVTFVMLNPSTADADLDDPTIRRCKGFAVKWNYAHLVVVNLFAFRATNPKELLTAKDPVGPDNFIQVRNALDHSDRTILAWGDYERYRHLLGRGLLEAVLGSRHQTYALAVNKSGHPRHPLYVPAATQPVPYPVPRS